MSCIQELKSSEQILPVLEAAQRARSFEFAKAMQVCGELRDLPSLLKVWHLSRTRKIGLSLTAYSILLEAFAKSVGRQQRDIRRIGLEAGKRAWQWMLHEKHKADANTQSGCF